MKIEIDAAACVGAGQCVLTAEDLFDQDDDGIVLLLNAEPDESRHAAARRSAALCPARAITIHE
ncbi:ferredoxin [Salinibacterium amurskyense]|uniref:ferredoxin n=1 Tax=Salinibacterium amurskyense TaxID=205941 RepID=UPI00311E1128